MFWDNKIMFLYILSICNGNSQFFLTFSIGFIVKSINANLHDKWYYYSVIEGKILHDFNLHECGDNFIVNSLD